MSVDTFARNQREHPPTGDRPVWLFGYGSLIWKVDFPWLQRQRAHVHGWTRRLWQGSHDHRGTPQAPGRVATLVAETAARCAGMAYQVSPATFAHLDHREKNGYLRVAVAIELANGTTVDGLTYIAPADNGAWLGSAPTEAIVEQIHAAAGPSGRNRDYLLALADALRELGADDEHVFGLERELLMHPPRNDPGATR